MWVFLNNAFLSIVEDRADPDLMRVRGRLRGDIEKVFPLAAVFEPEVSDYRFHATVSRSDVADAMLEAVTQIDYPDFKSSVDDRERKATYSRVWAVMNQAQGDQERSERLGSLCDGAVEYM